MADGSSPPSFSLMRYENENTENMSSNDARKQLQILLNSVILQYLELLGLHKTCSTFIEECHSEGYALPQGFSSSYDKSLENADVTELRTRDLEQLLKLYDEGKPLDILERWDEILQKCIANNNNNGGPETVLLTSQLRIYCFLAVPFRRGFPDDQKEFHIQKLLEILTNRKQDDVQDPEMLSLYALPFVSNPIHHPVFSKFFTDQWCRSLRRAVKNYCLPFCKQINLFEADLAKLYRLWSNVENAVQSFSSWSEMFRTGTDPDSLKLVLPLQRSLLNHQELELPSGSSFKLFLDAITHLKEENIQLKQKEQTLRMEFTAKIQLCDALVECLQDLYLKQEDHRGQNNVKALNALMNLSTPPADCKKPNPEAGLTARSKNGKESSQSELGTKTGLYHLAPPADHNPINNDPALKTLKQLLSARNLEDAISERGSFDRLDYPSPTQSINSIPSGCYPVPQLFTDVYSGNQMLRDLVQESSGRLQNRGGHSAPNCRQYQRRK